MWVVLIKCLPQIKIKLAQTNVAVLRLKTLRLMACPAPLKKKTCKNEAHKPDRPVKLTYAPLMLIQLAKETILRKRLREMQRSERRERSEWGEKLKSKRERGREQSRLLLRQICNVSKRHPRACNEGPAVKEVLCVPACVHIQAGRHNTRHWHKTWQHQKKVERKRECAWRATSLAASCLVVARWQLNNTPGITHKPNLSLFLTIKASRDFRKPRVQKRRRGRPDRISWLLHHARIVTRMLLALHWRWRYKA